MAIQVTDEYYPEHDEHERFVSGRFNSASIGEDDITYLTIGGMPEIDLTPVRLIDLRDVLVAAVDLASRSSRRDE